MGICFRRPRSKRKKAYDFFDFDDNDDEDGNVEFMKHFDNDAQLVIISHNINDVHFAAVDL